MLSSVNIDNSINYRDELVRKSIHLCSLSIPIIYYFVPRSLAIWILGSLAMFALVSDIARYIIPGFSHLFYKFFGFMLRKHERDGKKKNLNGATYVLISALACVIIFPKIVFITAFAILIISDTSAALFGRKFGKHKFLSKSLEGTLAFFISALVVIAIAPKADGSFIEYSIAVIAAFIGAIVENVSYGYADDNLSIPLSIGLVMWLLYMWLMPAVNLASVIQPV